MQNLRLFRGALLFAVLAGCGGGGGGGGNDGAAPGGGSVSTGQAPNPGPSVTSSASTLAGFITRVSIASPPVVDFLVINQDGTRYIGLAASNVRFTLAKLIPGADGNPSVWQSYINRVETPGGGGPGTVDTIQATSESNGTFVNHGDGTYTYTFATDIANVTSPIAVAYQPELTHRLALQISGGGVPVANATHTWRPSDGVTSGITLRDIVQTSSCNECHGKLALHGGGRIDTKYCVTCHNPGSTDANSGNTVDFKVMIHKIHYGENLPSVAAGGEYAIWGFNDSKHDYSHVVLPQDIRNCSKCHDAADAGTPQGGNWMTRPSIQACGSCHDDVDFNTGANHPGGVASNDQCTVCHRPDGTGQNPGSLLFKASVVEAHRIPEQLAGMNYALNIISATNTAPGQFPVVTYEVTDPTNGNARYNILDNGDPVWANSSVAILLGWNTADYHNEGNGSSSTPASAVSLNGRAASTGNNAAPTANPDGTFTVTSLRVIPAGTTGSGVAALTARAGADFDGDGNYTDRVPIKSVVEYFAITDASPMARRSVVDIANCNQCHAQLTLHGSIRTDEPQVCVICHNANNTDINRRAENAGNPNNVWPPPDGKAEEAIDFKTMIHGIHAGDFRENGLVIYGFGNTTHDFGDVVFPGILSNCSTCHAGDSFTVPLASSVLATTIGTGAIRPDPSDDTNVTPTAAVCSSCHDSALAQTHMEQNGAMFNMFGDPGMYNETCAVCHAPGRIADVSVIHDVQ